MNTDFFQISPVSIAPLAELMFSLVITLYFLSVREKTFDTRLITVYSCITTCMFALNFVTTATLQSAYGPEVEKLQYIIVACLSSFTILFAYLFGGNPFKKEMAASFSVLLLLFAVALYRDKIGYPHILPVYVLTAFIVITVFLRKARRSVQSDTSAGSTFAREALAYRGFAICFLFYLLINLTASLGAAGVIPPAWWMLIVQVFIYAFLFTFFISYLNYTGATVSFVTRVAAVLLYFNLMILGALGLVLFGVEMPGESGRSALNILAVLIPVSTLAIVIFVPLFLRRNLLKPLRRVLEGMKRVDAGDLSQEVAVTTNDEIGTLTENFNRMTGSLRIYASQMESLVAERTRELSSRQEKLENTLKELEETQQKLKKATEQKNRFFDNITHELKTPLTLILAPVEHLAASPSMKGKNDLQAIRLIDRNAKNLLTLVNQLLDLSKIESGELTIRETPGIISRVTGRIVNDFLLLAGQKDVDIRYENLIPDGPVLFDHERWGQITGNLLSNAIKFCRPGGIVHVSTQLSADMQAVLTVSDTGIGIPATELNHIFDRFYQVENSQSDNQSGTGLGLALVRDLCTLMHGKIEVHSRPGKGTTFTVGIPVSVHSSSPVRLLAEDALIRQEVPEYSDITIHENFPERRENPLPLLLIVEDNKELLDFLCMLFTGQYRVLTAANGKSGLEVAEKELPDVVISDVMMPELDGFGFLKALKENMATSHIGVVLLTAKSDDRSRIEGFVSGADQYLYKPFYPAELKLRVRNLLNTQEKTRLHFKRYLTGESVPLPSTSDIFVKKFLDLVEENLDNPGLHPEMLASEMAMSVRTLSRKISLLTGLTPAALIRNYRLKKAAAMLLSGKTVADAAYDTGFENPSYFSTAFKAHFHQTPKEYRQRAEG